MLARYRIPNGYARRHGCTAKDVDPAQLKLGTEVEMEHTRDREIARDIALDHLCESRGRPYYVRRAGVKHEQLLLKTNGLGAAECSTSPRVVRGGIGFLLGALLGGMVGGGVALAVSTSQFDITEPIEAVKRAKTMALVASGITILGAVGGLTVGAWKPEC
jgi:hypothetical protein